MSYCIVRALCASLAALGLSVSALAADLPAVQFSADGDAAIVTLSRTHGMIRGLVEKPLVYVYADGRVVIDRPVYMIKPGRYEFSLPAEQLGQMIAAFDVSGVMKLETRELTAERDALARARQSATGEVFMTADSTLTRIDFNFGSFAREGNRPQPVAAQIRFADVQIQAERYADGRALNALAAAERTLLALIDHPDMRRIGGQDND